MSGENMYHSGSEDLFGLLHAIDDVVKNHHKMGEEQSKNGSEFNVFKLCGVGHYELWHSKILAEFLDPYGSHGQGADFLRAFFRGLGIEWDASRARVYTEISSKIGAVSLGRLDILIEGPDYGIVIENKLFAAEQPKQLERYSCWLKDHYQGRQLLIFLTPNGRTGYTSEGDNAYRRLAYINPEEGAFDICQWLAECQKISVDAPFVRETIAQYRIHIQNVIKGEKGMNSEVCKAIDDNPAAAQLIFENFKTASLRAVGTLFERIIEPMGATTEGEFLYDYRECGQLISCCAGEQKLKIFLGFEDTGFRNCFVGVLVYNLPEKMKCVDDWASRVKKYGKNFDSCKAWPIWKYLPITVGEQTFCDWDGRFFQAIKAHNGEEAVQNAVQTCIEEICDFFANQCVSEDPE